MVLRSWKKIPARGALCFVAFPNPADDRLNEENKIRARSLNFMVFLAIVPISRATCEWELLGCQIWKKWCGFAIGMWRLADLDLIDEST